MPYKWLSSPINSLGDVIKCCSLPGSETGPPGVQPDFSLLLLPSLLSASLSSLLSSEETEEEEPGGNGGRDWSDAAKEAQDYLKPPGDGRAKGKHSRGSREAQPHRHQDCRLLASVTEREYISVYLSLTICHGNHGKPMQDPVPCSLPLTAKHLPCRLSAL